MKKNILRMAVIAVMAAGAMSAKAADTVIEGFENNADPAGWQQVSTTAQTVNCTNQSAANTPVFGTAHVTEGVASGTFTIAWNIASPVSTATNYYVTADANTTYWACRTNLSLPAGLANNTIPHNSKLRADVFNNSTTDTIQFALYVIDGASTLERGPLVPLPPNTATVYEWDMSAVGSTTGWVNGNGDIPGSSNLRGFLAYTNSSAPPTGNTVLDVDNIRIVDAQSDLVAPATPKLLSAKQGPAVGEVVLTWAAVADADLAGYRVTQMTDADFGTATTNRFAYPATGIDVPGVGTTTTLTGVPVDQTVYFRVQAYDNATPSRNESGTDTILGVRLAADGSAPKDLVVLDYNGVASTDPNFAINGYLHGIVYWGQALSAQTTPRTFASARSEAVDSGAVTLTRPAGGVVHWATNRDGESVVGETLSAASLTALDTYLGAGGDLFITGTAIAKDAIANTAVPAAATFLNNRLKVSALALDNAADGVINANAAVAEFTSSFGTSADGFNVAAGTATSNDVLTVGAGASSPYAYATQTAGSPAAVSGNSVVFFGFSFETIRDTTAGTSFSAAATKRAAVLGEVVSYLSSTGPTNAAETWSLYN